MYVKELVAELREFDVQSTVVAPIKDKSRGYEYDGSMVYRYSESNKTAGGINDYGIEEFIEIIENQKADIYHQHSWTTDCGRKHMERAKRNGMKIVFNVHVPGVVCPKGTMMYMDNEQCDGVIKTGRCASCWSITKGVSRFSSFVISRVPLFVSRYFQKSDIRLSIITALSIRAQIDRHKSDLIAAVDSSDAVIVVCQWLIDALARNSVDLNKLHVIRQGGRPKSWWNELPRKQDETKLVVGYLGRWDKVKGIHVLLEAVRLIPRDIDLEVRIFNAPTGNDIDQYSREILTMAKRDERIRLFGEINNEHVISELGRLDFVAVPSQWLETGPLVVYEALAAGTPVIGSNLGGIREIIVDGVNGILLDHANINAWSECLRELAVDESKRISIPKGNEVRTMRDAAVETLSVYKQVAGLV